MIVDRKGTRYVFVLKNSVDEGLKKMRGLELPECLTTRHPIRLDSTMSACAFQVANDFHDAQLRKVTLQGDEAILEIDRPYFIPWKQYGLDNVTSAVLQVTLVKDGALQLASRLDDLYETQVYAIACNLEEGRLEFNVNGTYDLAVSVDFSRSFLTWGRSEPKGA